jgi:hypothetical protein
MYMAIGQRDAIAGSLSWTPGLFEPPYLIGCPHKEELIGM